MNAVKTLFYMGIMHGFFTFYFPYKLALAGSRIFELGTFRYLALPFWLTGTLIIVWCSIDIIRQGHGTPTHLDPPKILIVNGLYRYVRNPIYFGAMLVLQRDFALLRDFGYYYEILRFTLMGVT